MTQDNTATATPDDSSSALLGAGLVLLSSLGFSAKAVLIKLAYRYGIDAVTLLTLRMLLSVPFFVAAAAWQHRRAPQPMRGRDWLMVSGLGILGYYLAALFDFLGLQWITADFERLVLFVYPTLVVILTAILYRRPVGRRERLSLALSYGGIALVFLQGLAQRQPGSVIGTALVFGSAWAYAGYLVGSGEIIRRLGATRFTAYAMTVACVASVMQFLATQPLGRLEQPIPVYGLALGMAVLSTVMPAFLLSAGIRRVGARSAALISASGPVSTLFLAALFLNEPVTTVQLAGTALVMAGVLTVSLPGWPAATRRSGG
ncbi:MAG: DMT family transporter [Betaproteobacteria bacterium]|nr:DMT family transporter [Betaproteobacteria bacterium]